MKRGLLWKVLTFVLCAVAAVALAGAWVVFRSPDPRYTVYEFVFRDQFHRYDDIIQDVAQRRGMDPMVVKAVVWRESRFRPAKVGLDGERGLMQITDAAASEWVKGEKIEHFMPSDLFDPKTNIEAGSWLLARALRRYQGKDDPLPFALAEYNAGRSRVTMWSNKGRDKDAAPASDDSAVGGATSQELQANISIPSTRNYVTTVQSRVQFYHQRGRL